MTRLTIEVPSLPDRLLSPNRSRNVHWGTVTKARNEFKNAVYYSAHWVKPDGWVAPEKARVTITFVYATNRRRDQTNLIAMWKHGEDMLVASGILVDDDLDHLETMVPKVIVDKARAPMTIIEIEEVREV